MSIYVQDNWREKQLVEALKAAKDLLQRLCDDGKIDHDTDDNYNDVCGEDHDGCDCEVPALFNRAYAMADKAIREVAKAEAEAKESAAELCKRLEFEEPSEEEKKVNLNENLDALWSKR